MSARMIKLGAVLAVLLVSIAYLVAPFYHFFAEDNPAMTGPFGWTEVHDEAPYAEGVVDPDYRVAAERAKAILNEHRALIHAPALSAAIAIDGEVVWSAASGWADIRAGKAATPSTLFRIGSTSKAVTGTLFARMVDAGLVEVDAPISDYIKDLPNEDWRTITPRRRPTWMAEPTGGRRRESTETPFTDVSTIITNKDVPSARRQDVREPLSV